MSDNVGVYTTEDEAAEGAGNSLSFWVSDPERHHSEQSKEFISKENQEQNKSNHSGRLKPPKLLLKDATN